MHYTLKVEVWNDVPKIIEDGREEERFIEDQDEIIDLVKSLVHNNTGTNNKDIRWIAERLDVHVDSVFKKDANSNLIWYLRYYGENELQVIRKMDNVKIAIITQEEINNA